MSTETDTPRIIVASFEHRDGKTYLRADTQDRVQLVFEVDVMALAIMSLTMGPAMVAEKAILKEKHPEQFQTPVAPDSPEGLEG